MNFYYSHSVSVNKQNNNTDQRQELMDEYWKKRVE